MFASPETNWHSKRGWIFENEKSTQVIYWLDLKITCTSEMLYQGALKVILVDFQLIMIARKWHTKLFLEGQSV